MLSLPQPVIDSYFEVLLITSQYLTQKQGLPINLAV